MKKIILLFALTVLFIAAAQAQITKAQLKGVWKAVAMGKTGSDTTVMLGNEAGLNEAFPEQKFQNLDDLIANAKDESEKISFQFLKIMDYAFIQFDGANGFGEGMLSEKEGEKPMVKKGTYTLKGNNLTTKGKGEQHVTVELKNAYLVTTNEDGTIMYMKKVSETLY